MLSRLRLAHLQSLAAGFQRYSFPAASSTSSLSRQPYSFSGRALSSRYGDQLCREIGQLVLVASSRSQSNVRRRRRRRRQNYRTAAASLQNDLDGLRIFTDH